MIDNAKLGGVGAQPSTESIPDARTGFGHAGAQDVNIRFFGDPRRPRVPVPFVHRGVGLAHCDQSLPLLGSRTALSNGPADMMKTTRTPTLAQGTARAAGQEPQQRMAFTACANWG